MNLVTTNMLILIDVKLLLVVLLLIGGMQEAACAHRRTAADYRAFGNPQRVTIRSYSGHAMEPFITRDGRYLLFNNLNDPSVNTNLHYAERIDDITFEYKGEIGGVNTDALEGVPSMDSNGNFYFVSPRSYSQTFSTIYQGRFTKGVVTDVALVAGISKGQPGHVIFDAEISADGNTLYFVDGVFNGGEVPSAADIVVAYRRGSVFERANNNRALFVRVNTVDALEYAPCISEDGRELFFTRLKENQLGIYRAVRWNIEAAFETPRKVRVIEGFVEAPTLSPDGRSLYYHKREEDLFVIYRVTR